MLLGCLCGLETAALLYVAGYLMKNRTAAFAPFLLGAVIVPASAGHVCIAPGAICLVEAVALVLLVLLIRRREKNREAALRGKKTL